MKNPYFRLFAVSFLGPDQTLGENVTPDSVRNRVKLTSTDVDDTKVTEFIKDATATIEVETDRTIDYTNCEKAEAAAIRNLAAIYCLAYISGGSSAGLSYSIGQLNVERKLGPSAEVLYREVERLILRLKQAFVKVA